MIILNQKKFENRTMR